MKWIETSIVVERVAVEMTATLFEQYGKNGFIEEDIDETYQKLTFFAELEEDNAMTEEEWTRYICQTLEEAQISFKAPIDTTIVGTEDWVTSWKDNAEPVHILPDLWIAPAWKPLPTVDSKHKLYTYDSELSFGTGEHETTFCCAQLIEIYGKDAKQILDIGTGTGILLLVAHAVNSEAKLIGIDIDEASVIQARNNCEENAVTATMIHGDLAKDFTGIADVIIANLTVDPLKILLPMIQTKLAKNGILIVSGIVDDRYDEIWPFLQDGWQIKEHLHKRNWHTLALCRKDDYEKSIYTGEP